MALKRISKHCPNCRATRLYTKDSRQDGSGCRLGFLCLLLAIPTFGLSLLAYIPLSAALSSGSNPYRCTTCGHSRPW